MKTLASLLLAAFLPIVAHAASRVTLTVHTPLTSSRLEMVEVNMSTIFAKLGEETVVVTDANGQEVPSQVTWDGKLIF